MEKLFQLRKMRIRFQRLRVLIQIRKRGRLRSRARTRQLHVAPAKITNQFGRLFWMARMPGDTQARTAKGAGVAAFSLGEKSYRKSASGRRSLASAHNVRGRPVA